MANENPITVGETGALPADLMDLTEEDAGKGVSFKQEDQLIPLIYILQSNSPVVEKRGISYIEGAEPGHFWLRNSLHPIVNGEQGILAIPCGMSRVWIEWLPQRQGFVMRHPDIPSDAEEQLVRADNGQERRMLIRKSNGNILQDTREFALLVTAPDIADLPFVLPCSGTKHSFARSWQTMFHQYRHPRTRDIMPSFARKYQLTTVPASNAQGKWFGIKFTDLGWVSSEQYQTARQLNEAMEKGEKRAEAPLAGAEGKGDDEIPF
jgi:hypothetical protein